MESARYSRRNEIGANQLKLLIQNQCTMGALIREIVNSITCGGFIKSDSTSALKRQISPLDKLKPRILRDNQAAPGPNRTASNPRPFFFPPLFFQWKDSRRVALSRCPLSLVPSSSAPFHRSFESTRSLRARGSIPSPPFNQPLPYLCAGRHSSRKIFSEFKTDYIIIICREVRHCPRTRWL